MDSNTLTDLKQFIRAELRTATHVLEERMDARFDAMDARFDLNDLKQDAILTAIHERFEDVEGRVTRLEARHA